MNKKIICISLLILGLTLAPVMNGNELIENDNSVFLYAQEHDTHTHDEHHHDHENCTHENCNHTHGAEDAVSESGYTPWYSTDSITTGSNLAIPIVIIIILAVAIYLVYNKRKK
ncbi:MAG: hypothetical protein KO202_00415 [Methanobacteriaceae archaeon]|jgi:hypothetical protein|nr:hypothetical protein [Methanobacteriaceae archaeon]